MSRTVRIGSSSAAWGDTLHGARQLVEKGKLDYLVGDYLAEVTMALLARARAAKPEAGFVPDWGQSIRGLLPAIAEQGIRLVTNAGGMNPQQCREQFLAMAAEAGLSFRVAVVEGDDLLPREAELRELALREMFSGAELPLSLRSVNAYLGAFPIARALDAGAQIVITGRCVDSALVLGPLIHEFGWKAGDLDRLAAGSLAGHIIECGAQATGGLFTDWESVADDWDDMGFPIVECKPDGRFTVTKPEGTGGRVLPAAVAEQILYEIGDPARYVLPDVVCDFTRIKLQDSGDNRVEVSGARGSAVPDSYKVCATWSDGYRVLSSFMIAGWQADRKGRRVAEALLKRCERLMREQGFDGFTETSVELIGAEDSYGAQRRITESREVVVKIGVRHQRAEALDIFCREFAVPAVSMAQGVTGLLSGRPKPLPVLRVFSFLLDKSKVPVQFALDEVSHPVEAETAPEQRLEENPSLPETEVPADATLVPLRRLAWGRSGDKGNHANIGIIARHADYVPYIKRQLSADVVAKYFDHFLEGRVTRYELPGLLAFNFLLEDVLGGGGTGSLRYDPQGKTYAQLLLDIPIRLPSALAGAIST